MSPSYPASKAPDTLKRALMDKAREAGFDQVGFTTPGAAPKTAARLAAWLAQGRHATMDWMATTAARRGDPRALWPEVRGIIMLGMNYGPDTDPLAVLAQRDRGAISVYARHRDYHDLVKKRLKRVARWLAEQEQCAVKVFVDTAPVMEKPLAEAANLGWQGKHTNLVSREFGSWLFLGAIFTDLALEPSEPHPDVCGSCSACLDICPTRAFPAPYELDARRCISYLTIEHKGHIAREFRAPIGNRIYGCDDCLAVCPWNKYAQSAHEAALRARPELTAPLLADLARLDDAGFRVLFAGSPIKRTGRDRFVRNVLIAIGNSAGNSGDPALLPVVRDLLTDASPLVRAMAVWAFGELNGEISDVATLAAQEKDAAVRHEWQSLGPPERRHA